MTRQRRAGDDDFDSKCLERAEKLRGRAAAEGAAGLDLLDHFTASCSTPMRGEESPVKAAQALQFGAEVKVINMGNFRARRLAIQRVHLNMKFVVKGRGIGV